MENFYDNEFEELIKEKADQYKMYPSDRVWKGIDRSLRSQRRWYRAGFVIVLSAVSYFAVTELTSPSSKLAIAQRPAPRGPVAPPVTPQRLMPFSTGLPRKSGAANPEDEIESGIAIEDSGEITASFEIPMKYLDPANLTGAQNETAALVISGLEPLLKNEKYDFELSLPLHQTYWTSPSEALRAPAGRMLSHAAPNEKDANDGAPDAADSQEKSRINWLQEDLAYKLPRPATRRIRWQLAFSPTVNYRKLTGNRNGRISPTSRAIPLALRVEGDLNNLVNHKPALGFELGTHGLLSLSNRLTFKGGIQFNYSKYDIRAYRAPAELATIALNSTTGLAGNSLVSYTNLRNFGGTSVEDLKNQYFQLSLPVGFEFKVLGNDKLQLNIASTIQPTYLLNRNTYLITTDFKNYTKEPSLVRRWNVNTGAEAFVSYNSGGIRWQIGPQFRYQLLSSYENVYPIKEYLMEYGIKVGITKTIR